MSFVRLQPRLYIVFERHAAASFLSRTVYNRLILLVNKETIFISNQNVNLTFYITG